MGTLREYQSSSWAWKDNATARKKTFMNFHRDRLIDEVPDAVIESATLELTAPESWEGPVPTGNWRFMRVTMTYRSAALDASE